VAIFDRYGLPPARRDRRIIEKINGKNGCVTERVNVDIGQGTNIRLL
jgi:hypothetical protein